MIVESKLTTPSLNYSQKSLFAGIVLTCMGPYLGYLGFLLIIISVVCNKVTISRYYSFFITLFLLFIGASYSVVTSHDYNLPSFTVCALTLLTLFLTSNYSLLLLSDNILKFVAYSVPFALIIAILQTLGFYPFEYRGNEVLGLMRFTFLFAEPSHYSLILALCGLIALVSQVKKHIKILLLCGLVLTWSISGFCILGIGYIGYKFYSRGLIKSFFLTFFIIAVSLFLWFFWLQNSDFWLASKIDSVLQLFSGQNVGASSAMLRFNSIIIGPYFLMEQFCKGMGSNALLGVGFGNMAHWVEYYYTSNFSLVDITDANNIISNVLISTGIVGLFCYLFAYSFNFGLNSTKVLFGVLMLVVLSLFSGYAFGSYAIITLLLTRIFILTVTNYGGSPKN